MRSTSWAMVPGPLAPFADAFRVELDSLGYTPGSREYKVNQMSRLSRWLEGRGLSMEDLDAVQVEAFLVSCQAKCKRAPTLIAMKPLLDLLHANGVIETVPATPRRPVDDLMDDYRRWMVAKRGLAATTVWRYEKSARGFLLWWQRTSGGGTGTEGLNGQVVMRFLLAEASRGLSPGSLRTKIGDLRALLRFMYLNGLIDMNLAEAVLSPPGWKDTAVPHRLAAGEVRVLLDSCDRTTRTGKRDFAMLLLLARLGLRANEVRGLEMGDLDWRAGELVVRGKARREDRLPLPTDVGEAVATYLVETRPQVAFRTVFLTITAPPRPMGPTTVGQTVWRQCVCAGLTPVRAHRLRHALATDLLDRGATLPEIAQVLRHRELATTALYAKVDYTALRELALPWPVTR